MILVGRIEGWGWLDGLSRLMEAFTTFSTVWSKWLLFIFLAGAWPSSFPSDKRVHLSYTTSQ